jgi:2-polyprenyl-6-hydroxyphenyl methylase/3-demethylubiquinone-9 3-methyltransferase
LGDHWYTASDDPVAFLRAESKIKSQWVLDTLARFYGPDTLSMNILDIGCGAGFLTNPWGAMGYQVTGIDLSESSLEVASRYDLSKSVKYLVADAYNLPFADNSFSVVSAMDFLEHVDDPQKVVGEVARVLKPGGIFFFHTFNRNWLSYLLVIKSLEWLLPKTPKHLHLYDLFIKPQELEVCCRNAQLEPQAWTGIKPVIFTRSLFSLLGGHVPEDFRFELTPSLRISYMGAASKGSMAPGV